jgi:hypothetical protein
LSAFEVTEVGKAAPPPARLPFQYPGAAIGSSKAQLFIRTHNEALTFVAMCVCNPDYSPVGVKSCGF